MATNLLQNGNFSHTNVNAATATAVGVFPISAVAGANINLDFARPWTCLNDTLKLVGEEYWSNPVNTEEIEAPDSKVAINLNGYGNPGVLSQEVDLHEGEVSVDFKSIRNSFGYCGNASGKFMVSLRADSGGGVLSSEFTDEDFAQQGKVWASRNAKFKVGTAGKYYLEFQTSATDQISPICGSFIADVKLTYVTE
jgi:hypothetical protein